jgi:hypothetical protein
VKILTTPIEACKYVITVTRHFFSDVFDFLFIRPLLMDHWFKDFFWYLFKRGRKMRRMKLKKNKDVLPKAA